MSTILQAVSTPLQGILSKTRYKKLQSLIQNHIVNPTSEDMKPHIIIIIQNHMWQECSESAREQRIELYINNNEPALFCPSLVKHKPERLYSEELEIE